MLFIRAVNTEAIAIQSPACSNVALRIRLFHSADGNTIAGGNDPQQLSRHQALSSGQMPVHPQCHDPSHGGFYMAEGAFYIRIGLLPHVVSGDCLVSSRYGLTARFLHYCRAYPMSRDWGCTSTYCRSLYVVISSMRPWRLYLHSHVHPLSW